MLDSKFLNLLLNLASGRICSITLYLGKILLVYISLMESLGRILLNRNYFLFKVGKFLAFA